MQRTLRAIDRLSRFFGVLSGLAIFVITITVVLDVVFRAALNAPIPGATEFSTLLLLALVYLGLASVQATKSNFYVEILVSRLPPAARRIQEGLVTLLAAAVIGVMAWYTGQEAWISTLRGEMSFGAIAFPIWPARITLAFGLAMLWLQLVCDLLRLVLTARPQPHHGIEETVK
ncbi:TRAP transporter small permease subunit [Afifella pfennigii]|uniref:TRAP transporter small permease subunit n=1 Tax=Afifella pfennigii TaxID=209897 RepID=UPI00047A6EA4|nr:TRAP transporter small permease [Afifella pfennigii]